MSSQKPQKRGLAENVAPTWKKMRARGGSGVPEITRRAKIQGEAPTSPFHRLPLPLRILMKASSLVHPGDVRNPCRHKMSHSPAVSSEFEQVCSYLTSVRAKPGFLCVVFKREALT